MPMLADAHISILGYLWLERLDVARLTVNDGHLDFQMYRGGGGGDYSSSGGWGGREKYFSRFLPNRPRPLSSFDTHARWQPVT